MSLHHSILAASFVLLLAEGIPNAIAEPTSCSYGQARYSLKSKPDVTAEFVSRPNQAPQLPLFLHVNMHSVGWDNWYEFDVGSGYSDIGLISINNPQAPNWQPPDPDGRRGRPHQDEVYYPIDQNLNFLVDVPTLSGSAPKYFFIPNLGQHIWYDTRNPPSGKRYYFPRALFVLDRCDTK